MAARVRGKRCHHAAVGATRCAGNAVTCGLCGAPERCPHGLGCTPERRQPHSEIRIVCIVLYPGGADEAVAIIVHDVPQLGGTDEAVASTIADLRSLMSFSSVPVTFIVRIMREEL